jgi:hypothetical protein
MPDLPGRDTMPARIWQRSGQLALAAFIGIAGSAALGQIKPTDSSAVRAVVDAAAARYMQENPQAAAIAIGVVYGPSRVQSRAGAL